MSDALRPRSGAPDGRRQARRSGRAGDQRRYRVEDGFEIIASVEEAVPGTALDALLRCEEARAIVELLTASRRR